MLQLVRYQLDDVIRAPAVGQHQDKNGYKLTINDKLAFCDWYNAYFEIQFQVQQLANGGAYGGGDRVTVIKGSSFSHMIVCYLLMYILCH